MSANLLVAGRITWRAELKTARNGSPMRSVLIAIDDEKMPPVRVLVFGEDAEHTAVGDFISVEGPPEITTYEKNGEVRPAVSMLAKWSKLSGHAGDRQRRSKAAKRGTEKRKGGHHQEAINRFAPSGDHGQQGPEVPPP